MAIDNLMKQAFDNALEKGLLDGNTDLDYIFAIRSEINELEEAHQKCRYFEGEFDKDSFESEYSDIFICTLTAMQHFGITIDDIETGENLHAKAENLYEVFLNMRVGIYELIMNVDTGNIKKYLAWFFEDLLDTAKAIEINLLYHVQEKMKYNRTRPYKHGA